MESANHAELVAAIALVCVGLGIGLYVSIHSLRHSLNIIKTRQFKRPLTGQLVTGQDAVWIGVVRALAAGVSLAVVLGITFYLVCILCAAIFG